MIYDFHIGQKAFVYLTGVDYSYRPTEDRVRECTIEAVGRKYITASFRGGYKEKYEIDGEYYSVRPFSRYAGYLYPSMEKLEEAIKHKEQRQMIRDIIFTKDVLRKLDQDELGTILWILKKHA